MPLTIIRCPLTKFSFPYDPEMRDPSGRGSYENARRIIDDARKAYTLSQNSHDFLILTLDGLRREYIEHQRLIKGTGDFTQDLGK